MLPDVLPLRAVLFQFLFLLVAIAIEAIVFYRLLALEHKTCVQYATTINLLSTCLGWIIFFNVQPFLPQDLQAQLVSYIFFERFFYNPWFGSIPPVLVVLSFGIFMGTFLIKLKGLDLLELLLEKTPRKDKDPELKAGRFRGRQNQAIGFQANSRAYAVLVANACSFTAILFLLIVRLAEQSR